MTRYQAGKRQSRHNIWLALAATIGLMTTVAGCGSRATTSAPTLREDGGTLGSTLSSPSSNNQNSSRFNPLNPSLPNDPNSLGGNFPSNNPYSSSSPVPGATASPLTTEPQSTASAAPGTASPLPLPSWAPPGDLGGTSGGPNSSQGGFGSAKLKSPQGLAVKNGKVYVADYDSLIISYGKVRIFDAANGTFIADFSRTSLLGLLPKTITGMAVGPNNLYVTDPTKGIYVYDLNNKYQRNVPISGSISAIAVSSSGNVYLALPTAQTVSKYNSQLTSISANFTGGSPVSAQGVAVDNNEHVYITDSGSRKVIKFDANGQQIMDFDGRGTDGSGQPFGNVGSLGVDARNGDIYVLDTGAGTIRRFDSQGKYKSSFGSLSSPRGIALDGDGTIYVSDNGTKSINVFTAG